MKTNSIKRFFLIVLYIVYIMYVGYSIATFVLGFSNLLYFIAFIVWAFILNIFSLLILFYTKCKNLIEDRKKFIQFFLLPFIFNNLSFILFLFILGASSIIFIFPSVLFDYLYLRNTRDRGEPRIIDKYLLKTLDGHKNNIWSVKISPNNKYIVSGSRDKTIKVWDFKIGNLIRTIRGHKKDIRCIDISPNNEYIVSGSKDKTIKLWELKTGDLVHTFEGHKKKVKSVVLSLDGKYIISGSLDKTIRIWNVENLSLESIIKDTFVIISVSVSPDGKFILSGSGWHVKIWDFEKKELIFDFDCSKFNFIPSVSFSPNGDYFLASLTDSSIKIWELDSKKLIKTIINENKYYIVSALFTSDGNYIVGGSLDRTIKVWEFKTGKLIYVFKGHKAMVWSVAIDFENSAIVSGSIDKTIKVWNLEQVIKEKSM